MVFFTFGVVECTFYWTDRNNLTDKISLISRMAGRYDKREGGIWVMGWTSYTKYNLQIFVQTENTQCVCNVLFRAVGRYDGWERGRGGWIEPVSQSTNLQIFVQSECTLCTIWNTNSMRSTFCFHPSLHTFTPFISFQALPQFICTACTAFYINQQTL